MSGLRSIAAAEATLVVILASVLTAVTSRSTDQESIHLSLIYRDSSLSPFYDPRESPYNRVKTSFARSKARLAYLINKGDTGNFQGEVEANDGEYFVNVSAGTPPVGMLLAVDTASELVLTRCLPCTNCNDNQMISMFDSSQSSTYTKTICTSSNCHLVPNFSCDSSSLCSFVYGYADFSHSSSFLGSDIFTFQTSGGGTSSVQDVSFGCEYDHKSTSSPYNGVLGLGLNNLSLAMQMTSTAAPKFTYCLGNHSDPEAQNRLVLGNATFLEGQTTSLKVINGRYNVLLEGISIGKKRLPIEPEIFEITESGGGVIIDIETMLTFLEPDAYYLLADELEKELRLDIKIWPDPPYERCYNGKISEIRKFHGVIFHFDGEVNVLLNVENLFLQVEDDLFCLAILPSPVGGTSVLGSLFQQSYGVGYNLNDMLISFQRIDCELLDRHLRD